MDFYIPQSLYRIMGTRLLLGTLRALGQQGASCRRFLECLEIRPGAHLSSRAA